MYNYIYATEETGACIKMASKVTGIILKNSMHLT